MTGWVQRIGVAGLAALALYAGRGAGACAKLRRCIGRCRSRLRRSGGFVLKVNAELVLTNVVVRDAKTGELVRGTQAERLQHLRKRQAAADRDLRL